MRFIINRGSIIFITCTIVSILPVFLASTMIVYINTLGKVSIGMSSLAPLLLYLSPAVVFLMGDFLFYKNVIKNQEVPSSTKWEAIVAFFMAFVVIYIIYFLSIELVAAFLRILTG